MVIQPDKSITRLDGLAAIDTASQIFLGHLEEAPILEAVCSLAIDLLGASQTWLAVRGQDVDGFHPAASRGFPDQAANFVSANNHRDHPAWRAIQERESLAFELTADEAAPHADQRAAASLGSRSGAILPLTCGDRVLGSLQVFSEEASHFTPERLPVFQAYANQAALAVHRVRLLAESRQQAEDLRGLNEMVLATSGILDRDALLERLYEQVRRFAAPDTAVVALHQPDSEQLQIALAVEGEDRLPSFSVPLAEAGLTGWVVESRQPLLVGDLASDALPAAPRHVTQPARTWLGVPLIARDRVLGAVSLQSFRPHAFSPSTLRTLELVAGHVAIALENAHLFSQAQQRLRHLEVLREVDIAISSSLDLSYTLDVLLGQVLSKLHVDAADVLLFNPHTLTLETAARQGFQTGNLRPYSLKIGDGPAGQAALRREAVVVPDLYAPGHKLADQPFLAWEGFGAYVAAPLVAKGWIKGVLEIYHRSPLKIDQEWLDFLMMLARQAALAIDNAELYETARLASSEMSASYDATLEGWSKALELRDIETVGHTQRVTELTLKLAEALGMGKESLLQIRRGALLHDIGKMGIPDSILFKPGPLDAAEWQVMRRHPVYAYQLLASVPFLRPALDVPYAHHERWDGGGYPRGLQGEEIPLAARIFAVADVWDALLSDRPYRDAWPKSRVLRYIRRGSGTQFDPRVVEVFLRNLEEAV